jgi:hypothetical protein
MPAAALMATLLVSGCGDTTALPGETVVSVPSGKFNGDLALGPAGCEAKGKCQLLKTFSYVDSKGVGWEADKGNWTDGASIPQWAKPIVGESFDEGFIKAAIIHDHYCDRHVRPWEETHWVFYDALRANNVSEEKAKLMYFAVMVGGPKWEKLDPAKTCTTGANCQKTLIPQMIEPRSTIQSAGKAQYLVRPATYNDPDFKREMAEAQAVIAKNAGKMTLEEVAELARKAKPGDYYLSKARGT